MRRANGRFRANSMRPFAVDWMAHEPDQGVHTTSGGCQEGAGADVVPRDMARVPEGLEPDGAAGRVSDEYSDGQVGRTTDWAGRYGEAERI